MYDSTTSDELRGSRQAPRIGRPAARRINFKRVMDLALGVPSFVLAFPVIVLFAAAIRLESRGPALYWSKRYGVNGRVFWMPKLRSMRTEAPEVATAALTNPQQWITPLGRLIRATSIDELPQLWSVLRGEMSLVGPRPVLISETELMDLRRACGAHRLRPGITGLAQVRGRDALCNERKVKLDQEYLHTRTALLDLRIMLETVVRVVRRDSVSH